ncbi:DHS-like NAD/FAD-binding domain-containing protein [Radiomyces spectabilis]|uniref:DHS-like NAD/FAD-binding domain-containing protein n=1 Tax=Radiomyces spectabilis TaxID=64574 RepID=UPI002220C175|nr:DHS-like NAD/FAD-binding domain-containing protein [Radiomyces spectabilis]KAI8374195.1 DHS-like NAD/FAD-binding domain-containing protein [Radiomyces spectabilis]
MPGTRSQYKAKTAAAKLDAPTIEGIVNYIKKNDVKRIIVMSGAGISTDSGIPDFRSKGTGLYDNLQKFNLPYAEAIFDIDYFMEKPEPFYALAKELYPGKYYPTKTHYFIRLLHEKGMLLRNFTQNIDTLERLAGLDEDLIVEAHGSFATASCVECKNVADPAQVKKKVLKGEVARCSSCDGLIKPDITFFGQNLPKRFFKRLHDFSEADLLIVIGTSLQVQPFASLIDDVPDYVPRLLINKEKAGDHHTSHSGFDFKWKYGKKRDALFLGDCNEGVQKFAELMGWKDDLESLYNKEHAKLKSIWEAETLAEKVEKEHEAEEEEKQIEKETKSEDEKQHKEIEALAKVLEEKLHIPSDPQESKDRSNATSSSK